MINKKDQLSSLSDQSIDKLTEVLGCGFDKPQIELVHKALELADQFESRQHPMPGGIDVALILKKLNVDYETIAAAVLTDPRFCESLDEQNIEATFGHTIAVLIENAHRLNTFNEYSKDVLDLPDQIETLRRMLLAMVDDVRAVIIKLAYRIQRFSNLSSESDEIRNYIARETLNIFAPLANRMGIAQLKWELEDLSFRYLEPQIYKKLAKALAENRTAREQYLDDFTHELRVILDKEGINAKVEGRPKHIYSIWQKMQKKQLDFSELYDIRAVRIITDKIASCYEILGLVHSCWRNVPDEFDDYIANPKGNGYQSLHTVVIGPQGAMVEIQIRTQEMHEFAELGVAAHWHYKEGGRKDAAVEKSIAILRLLLESSDDDESLLAGFQTELYSDRIFVLTPKGQIKDLIKGATPLDFAYAIHTEVGHRCRGAKVDGKIVPLTCELQSGQRVEILTTNQGGPNRSWMDPNMGYLKSTHAINKVKAWFRQQDHEQNLQDGKSILEKECHRLGLSEPDLASLTSYFHLNRQEDLLIRIGRGDISLIQLAGALEIPAPDEQIKLKKPDQKLDDTGAVSVQGVGNILTHYGRCCRPVPGDQIVGYITQGKGITIHRQECKNMLRLSDEKKGRLIDVSWGSDSEVFPVQIIVKAFDRQGLLRDITQVFSAIKANILDLVTHTDRKNLTVTMELTVEIKDTAHLTLILDKLSQINNVMQVSRAK